MPTVIDSLVVQFGLDTRPFDVAMANAIKQIAQLKNSAGTIDLTLKKTEEAGRRTATQMSSQGNVAAEYFSKIKNQALGLLAVLIGGKSLSSMVRDTVTSLAQLGRAATNIGVNVGDLTAFRNAIEANGGSAEAATASFQGLANAIAELKATGTTAILPALNVIGAGRANNPLEIYQKFVAYAAAHKADIGNVRLVGRRLNLDEGTINEALRGTGAVSRDIAEARRSGVPTEAMTQRAQDLQRAWYELQQTITGLTNILVDSFTPQMTWLLRQFREFAIAHPVAAGAGLAGAAVGGTILATVLGGILFRLPGMILRGIGFGGARGAAGALAGAAGGAGLTGAAAALTAAAASLEAAAVALGGAGVAGRAGAGAAAAAAGAGGRTAGRTAARGAARRGITRMIAGKLMRWVPLVGWIAAEAIDSSGTAEDDTTMAPNTGGVRGGDPATLGMTDAQYDIYRGTLGKRESGGRYGIVNRYGYAGKYQFGGPEIRETAQQLGETPPSREQFLKDPAMQERYMLQYTLMHHRQLMRDPVYAAMTPEQRAGALATAHLKGVGNALKQLHGGSAGVDANQTSGASYNAMMINAMRQHAGQVDRARAGQQVAMNDNAGGGDQTVHVNGPIVINTNATDAKGIARGLRGELAGRRVASPANTGLA